RAAARPPDYRSSSWARRSYACADRDPRCFVATTEPPRVSSAGAGVDHRGKRSVAGTPAVIGLPVLLRGGTLGPRSHRTDPRRRTVRPPKAGSLWPLGTVP